MKPYDIFTVNNNQQFYKQLTGKFPKSDKAYTYFYCTCDNDTHINVTIKEYYLKEGIPEFITSYDRLVNMLEMELLLDKYPPIPIGIGRVPVKGKRTNVHRNCIKLFKL